MSEVFVSYKSDDRAVAEALARILEAHGREVWWDREALRGGDAYRDEIEKALDAAKAVVVLWSSTAVASDWVRAEAGRALEGKRLVPVRLDAATRIPMPFNEYHTIDLTGYRGGTTHQGIAQLLASIDKKLESSIARRFQLRVQRLATGDDRTAELKAAAAPVAAAILLTLIHLWLARHVPSWTAVVVGAEIAASILAVLSRVRHGLDEALRRLVELVTHPRALVAQVAVVLVASCFTSVRVARPPANVALGVRVLEANGRRSLASGTLDEEMFHDLLRAWPWGRELRIEVDGHRTIGRRASAWAGVDVAASELRPLCGALLRLPFEFLSQRKSGARLRVERDGAPIGGTIPFEDLSETAILVGEDERDLERLAARIDEAVLARWRNELAPFKPETVERLIEQWADPILFTPNEDLPLDAEVVVVLSAPGREERRTVPISLGGVPYPERFLEKASHD